MKRAVTTYVQSGRTFQIFEVRGEGPLDGFWGVEETLIDENGRLKQTINGAQGHRCNTLKETLTSVRCQIKYDELVAKGHSTMAALLAIHEGEMEHEQRVG